MIKVTFKVRREKDFTDWDQLPVVEVMEVVDWVPMDQVSERADEQADIMLNNDPTITRILWEAVDNNMVGFTFRQKGK